MAMTKRGTRKGNRLGEWADALNNALNPTPKKKPKFEKSKPLFPKTKMKPGVNYRLPQKRGSRGRGTYKG